MTSAETGRTRIIDANLNRIGEGLRVLEDCARLILNDPELTGNLKNLRHRLVEGDLNFNTTLLDARNAAEDVGSNIRVPGQDEAKDLQLVIVANSRRVQESLRVIEEMAKMPGEPALDPALFQDCRFQLYTIERALVSSLLRQRKKERLSGLYGICDASTIDLKSAGEYISRAISAGACAIELKCPAKEPLILLRDIKALCEGSNTLLLIRERADLAEAGEADGVSLNYDSLPIGSVRKILPFDQIIGCSVTGMEAAVSAQKDGADYIIINTTDLKGMRRIKKALEVPVIGVAFHNTIGNNMAEVKATGVDAIGISF